MAAARTPSAATGRSTAAGILVVDDNQQNLELLEVYLEELSGVTVRTACDGMEAMKMVAADPPDLILLDIMMPRMSGFEVCKQIKSNPRTRDILIVMVTALNETGDIERATECGADDYLSKPIDRKALVNLVKTLLAGRASA
ncbi:MAG: response regulator [Phycisphaerales bacterium]|nr:response regulator [Phycisphaerales bacterium]